MTRMNVGSNNRIELQNTEAVQLCLLQAVQNKLFPNMAAAERRIYRVACVADMPAPSDIVRMQNIEPADSSAARVFGDGRIGLSCEKGFSRFGVQQFLLRKCDPFLHNLIPDSDHCGQIFFFEWTDNNFHFNIF